MIFYAQVQIFISLTGLELIGGLIAVHFMGTISNTKPKGETHGRTH